MKIRFAFHRPKGERGIGKAIVAWTWLLAVVSDWSRLKYNYSHVEIWFPDGDMFVAMDGTLVGQCFSSTTRGDAEGVRFAPASEVIGKHPERWDYIECEVKPDSLLEDWMPEIKLELDKKYDFAGILGFINPFNIQDENKWYCSEICAWVAFLFSVLPQWYKRISPRRLARVLVKETGNEIKSV